jgi:hypothetical protein
VENVPAAAIDRGPWTLWTSSVSTNERCAMKPASMALAFNHRQTYFPPKQYPTPPSFLTPISPLKVLITLKMIGSTVSILGILVSMYVCRLKFSGGGNGTSFPLNKSGMMVRYPLAANWSAMRRVLGNVKPNTSVRRMMALCVDLSFGYARYA